MIPKYGADQPGNAEDFPALEHKGHIVHAFALGVVDVRETEHAYELHGELPGIERENLNIEFTDPRTIQIRGRVERTKEQQPETAIENEQTTAKADDEKTAASHNSHRATVEDDPEETASNASWTSVGSPKPAEPDAAKKDATEVEKAARKEPVANNSNKTPRRSVLS